MTTFTAEACMAFRRAIGTAIIGVQNQQIEAGFTADDIVPELIAALLSLGAHLAKNNGHMTRSGFEQACRFIAEGEWPRDPRDVPYTDTLQ